MIFEKMRSISRGWIYAGFLIVTLLPLMFPIPFPVEVSATTQAMYDAVDALKPGDTVLYSAEFSADMSAELYPGFFAVFEHMMSKPGVKVVLMATSTDGPMFIQKMLDTANLSGKKYGEDIANFGYLGGGESSLAAICQDFQKTFPRDYYGADVASLPATQNIKKATDFALIINDSAGGLGPVGWIRQANTAFGVKVATILGQDMALSAYPYIGSGQLVGLLAGLRGAAEYERIAGTVGKGTAGMGAQSTAAIYFMLLLVLANIGYWGTRSGRAGRGAGGPKVAHAGGLAARTLDIRADRSAASARRTPPHNGGDML